MPIFMDKDKKLAGVENPNATIDKYSALKWIFDRIPIHHDDDLALIIKNLRNNKSYSELEIIHKLYSLILDNVLANIADLECVKIIIE